MGFVDSQSLRSGNQFSKRKFAVKAKEGFVDKVFKYSDWTKILIDENIFSLMGSGIIYNLFQISV